MWLVQPKVLHCAYFLERGTHSWKFCSKDEFTMKKQSQGRICVIGIVEFFLCLPQREFNDLSLGLSVNGQIVDSSSRRTVQEVQRLKGWFLEPKLWIILRKMVAWRSRCSENSKVSYHYSYRAGGSTRLFGLVGLQWALSGDWVEHVRYSDRKSSPGEVIWICNNHSYSLTGLRTIHVATSVAMVSAIMCVVMSSSCHDIVLMFLWVLLFCVQSARQLLHYMNLLFRD